MFETIWFCLLVLFLGLTVSLDGMGIGAGVLCLFDRDNARAQSAAETLAPVWHANHTWLVISGGALFGAFPLAYGAIVSALYIPTGLMLLGLIARGVALELLYEKDTPEKDFWGVIMAVGSTLAAAAQGFGVGAVLDGLIVVDGNFAGGTFSWLSPFSLLGAVALPLIYATMGAAMLSARGDDETRARAWGSLRLLAPISAAGMIIVAAALAMKYPFFTQGWFGWPGLVTSLLPLLAGLGAYGWLITLRPGPTVCPYQPIVFSLGGFVAFAVSVAGAIFPYLIPGQLTVQQAAAQPLTLKVMLVVIALVLPVVLIYTFYMYRVFLKAGPALEH